MTDARPIPPSGCEGVLPREIWHIHVPHYCSEEEARFIRARIREIEAALEESVGRMDRETDEAVARIYKRLDERNAERDGMARILEKQLADAERRFPPAKDRIL